MFSSANQDMDLPQKSLQIKQDDKFFSRLLSKESSITNPSFRVYYGGVSVAVPFMWESQPGTPKYTFSEKTLPPLTPPPSYYTNCSKKPIKKHPRSNLLHFLFPRINSKKTNMSSSSSSSTLSPTPSSASSWSSSLSSSSTNFLALLSSTTTPSRKYNHHRRRRFSSLGSSFDSRVFDDVEEEQTHMEESSSSSSPTSTLCFGISWRSSSTNGGIRRCYAVR